MDKIYVICSGEYSDWNIEGYATEEDDAVQICAQHNLKENIDDWYFIEANKIEKPERIIELNYIHEVYFHKTKNGTWEMEEYDGSYSYFPPGDENGLKKSEIHIYGNRVKEAQCNILLKTNDRKKAEKIAQDMFYAFLAEHEGL